MSVILLHPTGNANVRAAALGFDAAELLNRFYTSIACFPNDTLSKLGSFRFLSEIQRRQFEPVLKKRSSSWPWMEIGRLLSNKLQLNSLTRHEKGYFSIDSVYKRFDAYVASVLKQEFRAGASAVYAYEDGAAYTFAKAKQLGMSCFYDLPIGYWRAARALLENEKIKWPQWKDTLTGFKDSNVKLARKDKELELADGIFVASSFTASTLSYYPGKLSPVHIVPYGFPDVTNSKEYEVDSRRPLKALFVGGLSQRKGLADLFSAVDNIGKEVMLTVVGRKPTDACDALNQALKKHTWIPSLSHASILSLMKQHDVLIFPSLFEGFGLVITEAMSQGTPVITTDRTAGPDIIKHGENGWIIEAGSTKALQSAIENLLYNFDEIAKVGAAARQTAMNRPWNQYGKELASMLLTIKM